MSGAFLMSRDVFNHDIWNDVPKFRIFFYIVGNAVFAEQGVKKAGINIGRGQYLRSYRNIRQDLVYYDNNAEKLYSLGMIKNKIDSLVEDKMIQIEETRLGTLFTVVNYAVYQGFDHYRGGGSEQQMNSERTANEQPVNNNNNVKKVNKVKQSNKEPLSDLPAEQFEKWWNLYGNKKGKPKCFTKYKSLLKKYTPEIIEEGTIKYHDNRKALADSKQFVPQIKNPLTFLNGEHFNDEYENVKGMNGNGSTNNGKAEAAYSRTLGEDGTDQQYDFPV